MVGTDISVSVDVVDTMAELVSGEALPTGESKPDMVLSMEDAQHLRGLMLTGWKTESDLLKGWASKGVKKDQILQWTWGGEAGELAHVKSLHVKVGRHVTGLNVLFDESVPDTVIRYGAAAKVSLKTDEFCQWVNTVDRKKEYSKGLYSVPLLDSEGYIQ
jgi:hypothetical protein